MYKKTHCKTNHNFLSIPMTTSIFQYSKPKVIQALRFHFISRKEIKYLMIFVNVFALFSAGLFYGKVISPFAFLVSSVLWIVLMIVGWFVMPQLVYLRSPLFKDSLQATLTQDYFGIENNRGSKHWPWPLFSHWIESPHFFYLYFDNTRFFLVPKEAFEGEGLHEARKMLSQYIG